MDVDVGEEADLGFVLDDMVVCVLMMCSGTSGMSKLDRDWRDDRSARYCDEEKEP